MATVIVQVGDGTKRELHYPGYTEGAAFTRAADALAPEYLVLQTGRGMEYLKTASVIGFEVIP